MQLAILTMTYPGILLNKLFSEIIIRFHFI
jgi:hypothetical protein